MESQKATLLKMPIGLIACSVSWEVVLCELNFPADTFSWVHHLNSIIHLLTECSFHFLSEPRNQLKVMEGRGNSICVYRRLSAVLPNNIENLQKSDLILPSQYFPTSPNQSFITVRVISLLSSECGR